MDESGLDLNVTTSRFTIINLFSPLSITEDPWKVIVSRPQQMKLVHQFHQSHRKMQSENSETIIRGRQIWFDIP